MYTYIAQDIHQNWFTSKCSFKTKEEALDTAYSLAEYPFIVAIEIVKCKDKDTMFFNLMSSTLN